MTSRSASGCSMAALARLLLCCSQLLLSSGCVWLGPGIPVRVPTQTKDIAGTRREIDLTFLRVGLTTREEVEETLQGIDTKIDDRSLFWGRWESSGWAWAPMVAATASGCPAVGKDVQLAGVLRHAESFPTTGLDGGYSRRLFPHKESPSCDTALSGDSSPESNPW